MSNNKYTFLESPNYGDRRNNDNKISILVHHYTVLNFEDTKKAFLNKDAEVSAHYVIDIDGSIYQFVKEDKRAWHAGVSFFNGISDVNSYSIGIEIVNPGYDPAKYPLTPYPEVQIKSVIELSQEITKKYDILPFCVVGHSDISPARKLDPGPHYPWKKLSRHHLGLFPSHEEINKQNPAHANVKELFETYGYDVKDIERTKKTFKLHYNPQEWIENKPFNDHDIKTLMALVALKQK